MFEELSPYIKATFSVTASFRSLPPVLKKNTILAFQLGLKISGVYRFLHTEKPLSILTHTIHVWYIYLHLVDLW